VDAQLPNDFDPYRLAKKTANRARDQREQPKKGSDDDAADNGLFPYHESPPMTDTRFSIFFQWICGVAASLVTMGIVWMASISVSTARKVDVLIDRPEPVPRWQYENDVRQIKEDLKDTQKRVATVEERQRDTIGRGYEQR
jgi:hypothetical protein